MIPTHPVNILSPTYLESRPFRLVLGGRVHGVVLVLFLILLGILATYNLEYYPQTWFDEGNNLLAARTFAESGRYGIDSSDGFRPFDPVISTGPTVIIPTAIVFKAWSVGLIQGRIVPVVYLLLTAVAIYWVATQLYGRWVGLLAIVVFGGIDQFGPFAHGRHALGEIAAVCYAVWGVGFVVTGLARRRAQLWAMAGLLFGLAALSKNQFVILAPVLFALWLIYHARDRSAPLTHVMISLATFGVPLFLWYGYQAAVLGPAGFLEHVRVMSQSASSNSYTQPFSRALSAIHVLSESGFTAWWVAGLVYVWWLSQREGHREQGKPRLGQVLLPGFVVAWLAWYIVLSMSWPRYAVPALVIGSMFVAKLIYDLAVGLRREVARVARIPVPLLRGDIRHGAVLLAIGVSLGSGYVSNGYDIARTRDDSPQKFASVVVQSVPADSTIETFEWEIAFLAPRSYHFPPNQLLYDATIVVQLQKSREMVEWYEVPGGVPYLVEGPFAKWTGIYKRQLNGNGFERIASVGQYDLYRLKS